MLRKGILTLGVCMILCESFGEDVAARVVVVANSADKESMELARYYVRQREIPSENILAFDMPRSESISWQDFTSRIFNPLQETLVSRDWIQASPKEGQDRAGRDRWIITGHKIAYLVLCRGVPLKIRHAPDLSFWEKPLPGIFQRNDAAVDSELALLAKSDTPPDGFVPNPLFGRKDPLSVELGSVVKVGRLDGVSLAAAKNLVDQAMLVEKRGLIGRSYVDLGGRHQAGDRWLEALARMLEERGWDGDVDRSRRVLGINARFDMPVIYFGWYSGGVRGPFTLPDFRFPPGAIAMHIYSYSANSLRAPEGKGQWVQFLLEKGATATFGNVGEPYLEFSHHPHMILERLLEGACLGDAACYGIKVLSWQGVVIGDPLYRPFKVSFDEQWDNRSSLEAEASHYLLLRRMQMLARSGDCNTAIWIGQREPSAVPAIIWKIASLQRLCGDLAGERETLKRFTKVFRFKSADAPIAVLAAMRLGEIKALTNSCTVWRIIMESSTLPESLRESWLEEARAVALEAGELSLAERWGEEILHLKEEKMREDAERKNHERCSSSQRRAPSMSVKTPSICAS